jgi:hypothetical protein
VAWAGLAKTKNAVMKSRAAKTEYHRELKMALLICEKGVMNPLQEYHKGTNHKRPGRAIVDN